MPAPLLAPCGREVEQQTTVCLARLVHHKCPVRRSGRAADHGPVVWLWKDEQADSLAAQAARQHTLTSPTPLPLQVQQLNANLGINGPDDGLAYNTRYAHMVGAMAWTDAVGAVKELMSSAPPHKICSSGLAVMSAHCHLREGYVPRLSAGQYATLDTALPGAPRQPSSSLLRLAQLSPFSSSATSGPSSAPYTFHTSQPAPQLLDTSLGIALPTTSLSTSSSSMATNSYGHAIPSGGAGGSLHPALPRTAPLHSHSSLPQCTSLDGLVGSSHTLGSVTHTESPLPGSTGLLLGNQPLPQGGQSLQAMQNAAAAAGLAGLISQTLAQAQGSGKRSGASRRRKAKMYQALSAMVQAAGLMPISTSADAYAPNVRPHPHAGLTLNSLRPASGSPVLNTGAAAASSAGHLPGIHFMPHSAPLQPSTPLQPARPSRASHADAQGWLLHGAAAAGRQPEGPGSAGALPLGSGPQPHPRVVMRPLGQVAGLAHNDPGLHPSSLYSRQVGSEQLRTTLPSANAPGPSAPVPQMHPPSSTAEEAEQQLRVRGDRLCDWPCSPDPPYIQ
ncbi:hypothetical protein HaLaN_19524 [Haematococcus lacustris]|uniref:Uncharacterized protein n=1 Tax=Haematococcus lacustris TaxID=44745 RepID=A0A699ZIK1_HAELA|nr:hypothetical protein HaLaN_19524 [Haematococcus lacustris]